MGWFRTESSFRNHRKIKQLARRLGLTRRDTRVLMIGLFCEVCDQSPDGSLDGWEPEDIAEAADWDRDPVELLDALQAVGFLVEADTGGLEVNDWMEYAEGYKAAERRKRHRQRRKDGPQAAPRRNPGRPKDGNGTSPERPPDVPGTDGGRAENVDRPTDRPTHPPTDPAAGVPLPPPAARGEWPEAPIYVGKLNDWGINNGYGQMSATKQVEAQHLKCLSLAEVQYAHGEMQRAAGKPNWGYFLQCVNTYRDGARKGQAPASGDFGSDRGADFDNFAEGATTLIGSTNNEDNHG